jgi:DNA polymerase-1
VSSFLLPGWRQRLAARRTFPETGWAPPLARPHFAQQVQFVQSTEQARTLVQAAHEFPIACVGLDTEFRHREDRPLRLPRGGDWYDIRSIHPFCVGLALVSDGQVLRFVVDLRHQELLPHVQEVLDLPVAFSCHYAKVDLFALWSAGLRELRLVWDSWLAEKALRLGRSPTRRAAREAREDGEGIELARVAEEEEQQALSLDSTAAHYGLRPGRGGAKSALQSSFLSKPFDEPLNTEEIAYCADDAQLVASLREPQQVACDRQGLVEVLDGVLMPWNVTVAEIEWTGALFDRQKCQHFLEGTQHVRDRLGADLRAHGIANPDSSAQLADFLITLGLAEHFPRTATGRPSTAERFLKEREGLHTALPLVRRWRKVRQLAADPAVLGLITGADGRVHADFRVLGADTGRTQARRPNLMGIGRVFRPLVRAPEGWGIGDVDLSQIEVFVAAAVFGDEALIAACNQGDVYISTAKAIFAGELTPEDLALSDEEFKEKHKRLRQRTKPLVLGIIYGKTITGIAQDLKIPPAEARGLWERFRAHFPTICRRMAAAREQSVRRGYAYISRLRRFRASAGAASAHEKRALGNAYVQGTAALIFFGAGNRLRRLYRQWGARLIIPVHDSFVFEAPLAHVEAVADLTRQVVLQTVQDWFPELRPRAEKNTSHPACWNYEGNHDSVDRFLDDPMLKL